MGHSLLALQDFLDLGPILGGTITVGSFGHATLRRIA
jgi:hypothetical protein